jgi:peroxiredoxin
VNSEYPDSIWNINKFPAELRRIDPNKQNPLLPIGAIAPDWNLPTLEMDSLSLNSLKGNLVLLNFWSINCHGCIKSIPSLNLLHQKYASAGFKVVGVTSNEKSPIKIESIVQKFDIKFPILWKGETIEKMYQTWAHPTFYLLDKNGKIIYSMTGYSENEFNKMEKIIIKYYKKL